MKKKYNPKSRAKAKASSAGMRLKKVKPGTLPHCTKPEHVLGTDYGQD